MHTHLRLHNGDPTRAIEVCPTTLPESLQHRLFGRGLERDMAMIELVDGVKSGQFAYAVQSGSVDDLDTLGVQMDAVNPTARYVDGSKLPPDLAARLLAGDRSALMELMEGVADGTFAGAIVTESELPAGVRRGFDLGDVEPFGGPDFGSPSVLRRYTLDAQMLPADLLARLHSGDESAALELSDGLRNGTYAEAIVHQGLEASPNLAELLGEVADSDIPDPLEATIREALFGPSRADRPLMAKASRAGKFDAVLTFGLATLGMFAASIALHRAFSKASGAAA